MLIDSYFGEDSKGRRRTIFRFVCDECHTPFERPEKKVRRERPTHYCSLACTNSAQKSGGVLDAVRTKEFQARLGVPYPQQSAAVRAKSVETCMKRYGVENVQQVAEIKQRSCDTFLLRLEKRQKHLGVWTSKAENAFHAWLLTRFAADDVVRQKRALDSRRPIDFWIRSIDTYIQFDGVYWHGLDRPLHEIELKRTKHDSEIFTRWHSDREQDQWFVDNRLRLVRITDQEFDSLSSDVLWNKVLPQ